MVKKIQEHASVGNACDSPRYRRNNDGKVGGVRDECSSSFGVPEKNLKKFLENGRERRIRTTPETRTLNQKNKTRANYSVKTPRDRTHQRKSGFELLRHVHGRMKPFWMCAYI